MREPALTFKTNAIATSAPYAQPALVAPLGLQHAQVREKLAYANAE